MRILIVEDHADSAEVLVAMLTRGGHEVWQAVSCAAAVASCAARAFDLLITDLGLPDCDGWELLRQVRAICATPAIALSGYGRAQDVEHSRAAGFDAHLTKPINFATLTAAVDRLAPARAAG